MKKKKRNVELAGQTILVTGSPGFIGAHLIVRLLGELQGAHLISLDNMNSYYDPALKAYRLRMIEEAAHNSPNQHTFIKGSISDRQLIREVFDHYKPTVVVHLAAQPGVRHSIEEPDIYIESNVIGFYNILEACRHCESVKHLVFASSSSVYGDRQKVPFCTEDRCDLPVSLYAATKKSDELLAFSYAKLFGIPTTGLRFFTVYGPAGRPDMFYYSAADSLCRGETISLYNHGNCMRDFTYVDDVAEGVVRVMRYAPEPDPDVGGAPYALYNMGKGCPDSLKDFIETLEDELVRAGVLPENYDFPAHTRYSEKQPGDVDVTYADTTALERDFGYRAQTDIRTGLGEFARWYQKYKGDIGKPWGVNRNPE